MAARLAPALLLALACYPLAGPVAGWAGPFLHRPALDRAAADLLAALEQSRALALESGQPVPAQAPPVPDGVAVTALAVEFDGSGRCWTADNLCQPEAADDPTVMALTAPGARRVYTLTFSADGRPEMAHDDW